MSTTGMLISILTLNIWGLPDAGFRVLSPLRDLRVIAICEELKKKVASHKAWDVVLLQEVWVKEDREYLSTQCSYPYSAQEEDSSRPLDSGLVILSRYPLENVVKHKYPRPGEFTRLFEDGEAFAQKAALFARVVPPPPMKPFWVANTHLVSQYSREIDRYLNLRKTQFRQFTEIGGALAGSEPLIIGGDWNFGPNSPMWKDDLPLRLPGFNESPEAPSACTICPPNFMHTENEGKVDHLFSSPGIRALKGQVSMTHAIEPNAINVSDHFGWETLFQIP